MDQKVVDRLSPKSTRAYHWDDQTPGLCLVIQPTGRRTWRYQRDLWRDGRREKTVYDTLSGDHKLAAARLWAGQLKLQVAMGIDPTAPPPPPQAEGPEGWTVLEAMAERRKFMVERRAAATLDGWDWSTKYLTALHKVKLKDLTQEQCRQTHAAISKSAPYQANKAMSNLSAAWKFAREKHGAKLPELCPSKGAYHNPEKPRIAKLTASMLPAWAVIVDQDPNLVRRAFHWLNLLTGMRGGDLCQLERSFVQVDRIIVPARIMQKSKREFVVPMSAPIRYWIDVALRSGAELAPGSRYLFPSPTAASGHLMEWKIIWHGKETAFAHDLRKMYRTQLEAMVPKSIARSMVDHAATQLEDNYVMDSDLFTERLAAQEAVNEKLMALARANEKTVAFQTVYA